MELENSSVSCCSSPSTQLPPASANDGTCAGNQLDNRLQVVIWLRENYMVGDAGSMRKSFVYQHYLDACRDSGLEGVPISHTFFGKLVRRAFPGIRCNRKGPRGDAHQCYTHLQRLPTAQRLAPGQVELITEELAKASGNTCGGGGGGTSSPSRPRASSNRRSRSESHLLPSAIEGDESPGCSSSFSQPETPTDNNTTTYEEDYDEEEEGTLYEHYSAGPRGHDFPHRQGSSSTSSCCSPLSSPTSSTASYYEISSADMGASSTTTTPFSSTRASSFFCSSSPVSCNCSYHGFPPPPPPLGLEAEPEHAPGAAEEQIYHDDGDEEEEVPGGYSCLPLPLPRHHQYQHQQQSSLHLFPSFAGRVGRAGMMAAFDYTRLHHQQHQQHQQLFSGAIGGGGGGEGDHGVSTPPLYLEQQQQPFSSFTSGVPSSWHTLPTGGSNNGSTASAYYVPTEQHNSSSSNFFAHHTYQQQQQHLLTQPQQQQQHFEIPSPFYAINSGCDDDDSVDLEAAFSADLVGATAMAYPTTTTTRLAAPLAHHHPTTLMADGSSAALVGDEATGAWPSSSSAEMCGRSVEHPLWPAAWPDTIYS